MNQQAEAARTVNEDLTFSRRFLGEFNVDGLDAPGIIPTGGSCANMFTKEGFYQAADGFLYRD